LLREAIYTTSNAQRNATQEFLRNKKALRTFYATADAATTLAASCGAPRVNRNDSSNSTNQRALRLHSTTAEHCCSAVYMVRCV